MKPITSFFTLKNIVVAVIVVAVVGGGGYYFFFRNTKTQETLTVHPGAFLQQVSVSGKVTSVQDLDLSFEQPGIVKSVNVSVGDTVRRGKLLASQDTAQLYNQLAEMQAGIDVQKAKLNQLLAGSSPQNVKIAQDAVTSANQDLQNAYQSELVILNTSYNAMYNAYGVALYTQSTYFSSTDQQGIKVQDSRNAINSILQKAKLYLDSANASQDPSAIGSDALQMLQDLAATYNALGVIRDQCDQGVYYSRVTATDKTSLDTQKTAITTAISNVVSAQKSVDSYKAAVVQAQNNLDTVNAPSRPTDIAVFDAQIKQAQAQAQNVVTQIRARQIFSPIDGVVTAVAAKVGSLLATGQAAVSLISTGNFQVESYVPEIYISQVSVGNTADVTLDAYGADKLFTAKVISIDPAETIKDGVSQYKIILQLDATQATIKTGMTANVVITTEKKDNIIAVPQGIITSRDGKKFVQVKAGDKIVEREVETGDYSSSGQVEIVSGLSDGDVVILN